MVEMSTEPDSESKIWRLTGFGAGSRFLVTDAVSESIFLILPISVAP